MLLNEPEAPNLEGAINESVILEPNSESISKTQLCRLFKAGKCKRGDSCKYSHSILTLTSMSPCSYFLKGHCRRGNRCTFSHTITTTTTTANENEIQLDNPSSHSTEVTQNKNKNNNNNNNNKNHQNSNQINSSPHESQQSLYQKLVNSEILEEENILLQCIRFLVQEFKVVGPEVEENILCNNKEIIN